MGPRLDTYLLAGLLALLALSALVLGVLDESTADRIAENRQLATRRLISDIVPREAAYDIFADPIKVTEPRYLGTGRPVTVYRSRDEDGPLGVVFYPVVAEGYSGPIELAVGVTAEGVISGVRVISEDETEGLGDQVNQRNTDWLEVFAGRSFATVPMASWTVGSEGGSFDEVSGATITSRAVINAVRNVLSYHDLARDSLYRELPAGREQ